MRRRRREKKNMLSVWLMGGFVIFIMIASTLAFVLNDSSDNPEMAYNGFDFSYDYQNNQYLLSQQGTLHTFYSHPTQLESYPHSSSLGDTLRGAESLVVSFQPDLPTEVLIYQDQFRADLMQSLPYEVFGAIQEPDPAYSFPVVDCENATPQIPVVVLRDHVDTNLSFQNSCIIIQARNVDVLYMKDFLVYTYLGVFDGEEAN